MERYICIHGHFYQPPRENPWLETVEVQDSAYPYHDWNERIAAECYAPNAWARVVDGEGRIERLMNNYSKISFNFGPTLLAWMQEKAPRVMKAIVEADRLSRETFSGHGSALAQVYNHMIMPLANPRDKRTQVVWAIEDFKHWFGRMPEGMWLAEAAADVETLEVLAGAGIAFTILSPYQASRTRRIGGRTWKDVNGGKIDPSMAYEMRLPSGKKMAVFFYDAPVSQAVAFEQLLVNGETFASRVASAFSDKRAWDQLAHIATDGESYGHHHRHGEMALAYALRYIEEKQLGQLTNYGEFLEKHRPTHVVEIHEKSSWSCAHGVERWRSNCGCNSGGHPGWNQEWRGPLREALDWLRDQLGSCYEEKGKHYFRDPWGARDEYVSLILDRSAERREKFFEKNGVGALGPEQRTAAFKLLEMQRHAMLMYTSCGWFFDELSGIETVQVIQYAGRAIQLAQEMCGKDLEEDFLKILEKARSNIPEHQNGRVIYNKFVKPAMVTWETVVAHYAVSSLFEQYPERVRLYPFTFEQEDRQTAEAGRTRLAVGRTRVTSEVTQESATVTYAALYMGEHNLNGGVRLFQGAQEYEAMVGEIKDAFNRADFVETVRRMDRHFGQSSYSLKSIFRDEQRQILDQVMGSALEDVESRFRQISDRYTPLMRFLSDLGAPLPAPLQAAANFVLNADLRREFRSDEPDAERIRTLLAEAERAHVPLDVTSLSFTLARTFERLMAGLAEEAGNMERLVRLAKLASILPMVPFEVNLEQTQNVYYDLLRSELPKHVERLASNSGDEAERGWVEQFRCLGERLGFRLEGKG